MTLYAFVNRYILLVRISMKRILLGYGVIGIIFSIFSFGFLDPNFPISSNEWVRALIRPLTNIVYTQSFVAACIYTMLIVSLFVLYAAVLKKSDVSGVIKYWKMILVVGGIWVLSYPALSHDVFNYILTAKVVYTHHENPYVVMPIELLGEPNLMFTRAANKVALYGPVWIISTWLPHVASFGNTWIAIYTFKLFVVAAYASICFMIYVFTRDAKRVLFFAANPLVLIETFVSGHNDTFMMALALFSAFLLGHKRTIYRYMGWAVMAFSFLTKGATIVLVPVFLLFRTFPKEKLFLLASISMFGVFLLTPFREEMYPWYAIWFLTFVSLLPVRKRSYIHGAAFVFSLGLLFRYIPWIATREYGGLAPMIRLIVTWFPLVVYTTWYRWRKDI